MHYTGEIYRPPAEAYTPLLEVTYGCSHNSCIFCTMYKNTPFGIAKLDDIEEDIIELKKIFPNKITRIYLTGGDPFALSYNKLINISKLIHKHLKEVKTITCYASLYNLKNKTVDQLKELKNAGFNEIYIGIETGYEKALEMINKGVNLKESYEGLSKLKSANIDYMAILMLGIAGEGKVKENAIATAKLLNFYPPIFLGTMTTDIQKGSKLYDLRESGDFKEASLREDINEQIELLKNINFKNPKNVLYSSYHIVNPIQIRKTLDKKDEIIKMYEKVLKDTDDFILDNPNRRIAR